MTSTYPVNLEIRCRDCGHKWAIPSTISQDVLLSIAHKAAYHNCSGKK